MKETIIIALLLTTFSIENNNYFGKDITFDMKNNNAFEFTFAQDGSLYVQVDFLVNELLILNIRSYDGKVSEYSVISAPGKASIIPFKQGTPVKIDLMYNYISNKKGIIWMNPSINEIKVDLKQKYEWKFNYNYKLAHNIQYPLVYSIDKAKKDATLIFRYNNFVISAKDKLYVGNPLKICQGDNCKTGITTYEIIQGESYKLYINTKIFKVDKEFAHFLPTFSFYFAYISEEGEEEKGFFSNLSGTKIAIIIIIIILVIGVIILIIICCRRNRKSNSDIDNRALNKMELYNI